MMATHNGSFLYRRDTRCLLYWVIHAFNFVIKTSRKSDCCWKSPVSFNTSGTVTVDEFARMTRLIENEMRSVPSFVLELLRSVILARTTHWDVFQQYAQGDPQVEKSFASNRIFTIALYKAFEVFETLCTNGPESGSGPHVPDTIEEIILTSDYLFQDVRTLNDTGSENRSGDDGFTTHKSVKKISNAGKKGKRKKKAKTAPQVFPGEMTPAKVPLDDYHFLRTDDEQMTEYTMAVCSYFRECYSLRAYLQGIWREVAYDGLNIFVAGTLVQLAIGMVKKTELDVFADFPRNVQKAENGFSAALHLLILDDQSQGNDNASIDLREYTMSYTCQDLVDFVVDHQQKRDGRATQEERLKWRREYTVKWLYDFVNSFSYAVTKDADAKHQCLEDIDWRAFETNNRAVTGLQDFAAIVTSLAMEKPETYVLGAHSTPRSLCYTMHFRPFTVSRGWSINMLKGHVLMNPPQTFNPAREIELFLGRENEREHNGCLLALHRGQPGHNEQWIACMERLYAAWSLIGRSTWFLELAFRYAMTMQDSLIMVLAMFHLYNMLLYHSLQNLFRDCIFHNGEVPAYNFGRCLTRRVADFRDTEKQEQKFERRVIAWKTRGPYGLDPSVNLVFKKRTYLLLYRDADWDIESIPDGDIEPRSTLAMLRISQAKQALDLQTGKKTLEETDLIRRAKAELKVDDNELLGMAIAQIGLEPAGQAGIRLTGKQLLRLVKKDIYNEVCGELPLSGINHISDIAKSLFHYANMEAELDRLKNPLFMELNSSGGPDRQLALVTRAMDIRDEGCLRAMAGTMETSRESLKDLIYWEDTGRAADMPNRGSGERPTDKQCTNM
ncbi:hypothetical protein LX36DRAFT_738594 [Colletotrichum falcatum]|nr:hypothetical protein LX36DRAFT_738594 [Colletotrichum falcatum]